MKRLYDTHLFQMSEKKIQFLENAKKVDLVKDRISVETLEDDLKVIRRRFAFSLKNKVIDYVVSGKIIMIYSEFANLSKLIPIYLTINPATKEVVAVVNLRLYSTKDRKTGNLNIELRRLYALLECAYINREIYLQQNKFMMNARLYTLAAQIYVKLFNKILDKRFSLNLMPSRSDQVNFIIAKFFMIYVLEKPNNDLTNNVACSCVFNDTPKMSLLRFDPEFDEKYYASLPEFIEGLKNTFDFMHNIDLRSVIFDYITMYGDASIFSLEYFPSLVESCFHGVIFTSRIVKDQIYDSVCGKEVADLHTEFSRLLS